MIARQEIFLCDYASGPKSTRLATNAPPVGSMCGPLTELGQRSCGADVAGWLNATVPEQVTAHYDSGVLRLSIPEPRGPSRARSR